MTLHLRFAICLGLSGIVFSNVNPIRAQENGDLKQGHHLAQEVCAECHSVEADENAHELIAPSFTQIANSPGISPTALAVILRTPHETMPNLVLQGDELVNVVSYIMSLKKN